MKKRKLVTITEEHKELLEEFVNKLIETKRKEYHSNLEPFEAYAIRFKTSLYDHFLEFYSSFMSGYEVLKKEAAKK
jgi:hypothetical protein